LIYHHDGYYPLYNFAGNNYFEDQSLNDIFLEPGDAIPVLGGEQTGVWDNSLPLWILGNVTVPTGDTLIVESGVYVDIIEDYFINVYGTLLIYGEEQEPVVVNKPYLNYSSLTNAINFWGSTSSGNYNIIYYNHGRKDRI